MASVVASPHSSTAHSPQPTHLPLSFCFSKPSLSASPEALLQMLLTSDSVLSTLLPPNLSPSPWPPSWSQFLSQAWTSGPHHQGRGQALTSLHQAQSPSSLPTPGTGKPWPPPPPSLIRPGAARMVSFLNTAQTSTAQNTPLSSGQGPLPGCPRPMLAGQQEVLWGCQKAHSSGTQPRKGAPCMRRKGLIRVSFSHQPRAKDPPADQRAKARPWPLRRAHRLYLFPPPSQEPCPDSTVASGTLHPPRTAGQKGQVHTWTPMRARSPKGLPPKGRPGLCRSPEGGFWTHQGRGRQPMAQTPPGKYTRGCTLAPPT